MTKRQKMVLEFIKAYLSVKGYPPSYTNICEGLGIKSKSNVHKHIHALKEQGLLEIQPHKIRSIKLIDDSVDKVKSI